MSLLPSKKVKVVAFVVLIILIGLFWYVGKENENYKQEDTNLIYTNEELIYNKQREQKLTKFIEEKITEQGGLIEASAEDFAATNFYNSSNIKTSPDNSPQTLKDYSLRLKDYLSPLATLSHQEARLAIEAMEDQDFNKILTIQKRAAQFAQMNQQLENMIVPSKAIEIHLELLNGISHLKNLLNSMALALEEPLIALEAAKAYSVDALEFYNTLNKTNAFFSENNIEFSDTEKLKVSPTAQ